LIWRKVGHNPAMAAILFVCMGNICRSPTAEGVFRHFVLQAGLQDRVHIDSAGTLDYHAGSPPDDRACHHASLRGYDLSELRARQVHPKDFQTFDLVLGMDEQNMRWLNRYCPQDQKHKLRRLMEFAPAGRGTVVPDPYSGGADGFEIVLDHIEAACAGLLRHIQAQLPPL